MQNIPVVKLGLVAVSRDCFPIALSEKRRAAIAEKCGQKKLDIVEIKTTVENEKDMLKAVEELKANECNAAVCSCSTTTPGNVPNHATSRSISSAHWASL